MKKTPTANGYIHHHDDDSHNSEIESSQRVTVDKITTIARDKVDDEAYESVLLGTLASSQSTRIIHNMHNYHSTIIITMTITVTTTTIITIITIIIIITNITGSFGDFACASLYANKIIHGGDAGFVLARDIKMRYLMDGWIDG